ncbi:MAG TPA: sulfotransferase [Bordetella sp.]|jgi:tetratricopeptide (TPR) repeat protein|nr:sulfotransferase [Bordetella sp.]
MPTSAQPSVLTVVEALAQAHASWNAGHHAQADQLCRRVLAAKPGHPAALHLLGLMAHTRGDLDHAIDCLRQACAASDAPAAYSCNLAEMYRQKGMLAEAEAAARRAVALDDTAEGGWNNLGIVLQEAGKFDESLACLERVVALRPTWADAHNNLANTYRRQGDLVRAEVHYLRALELNPEYAVARSNLTFLLSSQGKYDEAAVEARRAIKLAPRLVDAYLNLADVEMSRSRYGDALAALDALQAFAPDHPAAWNARAKLLRQMERLDEALESARRAASLIPHSADVHYTLGQVLQSLGHSEQAIACFDAAVRMPGAVAEDALVGCATALMEAGRKDEALAAFDRALAAFPGSVTALSRRAELRVFRDAGDPDIAVLEACVAQGGRRPLGDLISAHFALGKAYLDVRDAPRAFQHFDAGNRRRRGMFIHDSAATSAWLKRIADVFTAERSASARGQGAPSDLPVFVIGMPRSGTTLIEQILGAHPGAQAAGELSALRLAIERIGPYPDRIGMLAADDPRRMGQDYLSRVEPLARGHARLIDKMPGNFLYAGLIPLMLPGARIVHARRDPVDTCLSCYTKLFAGEQRFAYDLAELGRFYRDYENLMAHWRTVLPADRYIEVDYEDVVDDLEGQARRLVEFAGLPWDDACLRFHEQRGVVRTASHNQVRQPIYTSSKGRWRAYAAYLGPLLEALDMRA